MKKKIGEKLRSYASDNLVNLGKKGKIKYWDEWGVYIGHCPLCSEVAYESTHCVFCGCEFEEPTEEEIKEIKEENHEIVVTRGNVKLHQVCNSLYEFRDGNLVSHASLAEPLTKEELEDMAEKISFKNTKEVL